MKIIKLGGGERVRIASELLFDELALCDKGFYELIILPIPTTRDKVTVTGTLVTIEDVIGLANSGTAVAGYGIPIYAKERIKQAGAMVYDAADDEDFLVENAKITAHGAICKILTETNRDAEELRIGIVGYGRIGSVLSELLLFIGAKVRIYTKSENKLSILAMSGADVRYYDGDFDISDLDILVNTAPQRLISEQNEIAFLNRGGKIIELASGKNFSTDKITVLSSIPDKMYPISAGRLYAKYIQRALIK